MLNIQTVYIPQHGGVTKTIMISDQAYGKLVRIKGNKSFSELLSELADGAKQAHKASILKFAGIIDKEEARELHRAVSQLRSSFKARL